MTGMNNIMDYADSHSSLTVSDLVTAYGMNPATARQRLSQLAMKGRLIRIGYGRYMKATAKNEFSISVTHNVRSVYAWLNHELPFTDFCVYSGNAYDPLQHHLSVNHAIYVETDRDAVESVFSMLKERHNNVYRQPDAAFMKDYVDLRKECLIVKPLVTESPVQNIDGVPSPTIEKLLVDILKDSDLEYMRGMEFNYMMESALSQYQLSVSKMLRYAGRRNIRQQIQKILDNHISETI